MGGRIAEEVFMNQMTTGASNDFEQATQLAQNMVSRWGMSDELGPRVYGDNQSEVFLGREMGTHVMLVRIQRRKSKWKSVGSSNRNMLGRET